jgi:hypothetical protein
VALPCSGASCLCGTATNLLLALCSVLPSCQELRRLLYYGAPYLSSFPVWYGVHNMPKVVCRGTPSKLRYQCQPTFVSDARPDKLQVLAVCAGSFSCFACISSRAYASRRVYCHR